MEPVLIGISLKMYFGYQQTLRWCARLAEIAADHPIVRDGSAVLFVLPSFPAISPVRRLFGEEVHTPPERAADLCIGDLNTISTMAAKRDQEGPVVVVYEPQWAIGATTPAAACGRVRARRGAPEGSHAVHQRYQTRNRRNPP
jgi:hypothetical protein